MTRILYFLLAVSIHLAIQCKVSGMELLDAIAQVESGANDYAIGKANERGRYQMLPKVWGQYSRSRGYTRHAESRAVAEQHLNLLRKEYRRITGREPSELCLAAMWQLGVEGYRRKHFNPAKLTNQQRDRAQRIMNLRNSK